MKASLKQPITQVKFTNVAFVKLIRKGVKAELACYKNKLMDYRKGVEKDLAEVLQVEQIFSNASKGKVAKMNEVKKVFPDKTQEEIIVMILKEGEIQISEKERDQTLENLKKDIAACVTKMTVNDKTSHPFPLSTIMQAMDEIHFKVISKDSAKKQALKLIKQLITILPIRRAKIKIKFTVPSGAEKGILDIIEANKAEINISEEKKIEANISYIIFSQPLWYKPISQIVTSAKGTIEIIDTESQEETTEEAMIDFREYKQAETPKQEVHVSEEKKVLTCSACTGIEFVNNQELKQHFKSEWHVGNVKRKSKGAKILSMKEFEESLMELTISEGKDKKGKKKDK